VAIVYCYGDNKLADAFAKSCAETIFTAYPNHSWWVECKGGVLVIKHMEASGVRGLVGMLRKMDVLPTGRALHKELIRAAGELLERAFLDRGERNEDPVERFDAQDKQVQKYWHKPFHQRVIH